MNLLKLTSFIAIVTHYSAEALPDTNIQIQSYDGPIFMSTPKPNCCPFCNNPLKPSIDNVNKNTCEPSEVYPQTVIINTHENPVNTCENTDTAVTDGGRSFYGPHSDDINKISDNCGTMLHTDTKIGSGVHKIPVTSRDITPNYGNTYTGTNGNTPHFGYDSYGTGTSGVIPLSSYLPINTATQNTCYQVPILTCNNDKGAEPVLVPQKFVYSLVLDGDVASYHNGYGHQGFYD